MLFFIDETWQKVDGRQVGALAAVALPQQAYNYFCTSVFGCKKAILGARELMDSEIKGTHCFAKAAFKAQQQGGYSHWLAMADKMFELLANNQARIFVIWTTDPALLTLRSPGTTHLSKPYKQLLFDLRGLMENEAPDKLGSLNFDLRGTREDEATAAALQNYMVRTQGGWRKHFIQVPNFTVSSVSPGLQAADMVAYLGAHVASSTARPELRPYVARLMGLRYEFTRAGNPPRTVRTVRRVG